VTVVAAITTSQGSWIGSDSMSSGDGICTASASPKVAKFGNLMVGFAGNWRVGQQLLEHCSRLSAPTLRQVLELDLPDTDWGQFLVVENQRIYEINPDKGVIEALSDEDGAYMAIGSGAPVCLGALGIMRGSLNREVLKRAMVVTAEHCTTVGGPFTVIG